MGTLMKRKTSFNAYSLALASHISGMRKSDELFVSCALFFRVQAKLLLTF